MRRAVGGGRFTVGPSVRTAEGGCGRRPPPAAWRYPAAASAGVDVPARP